MRDRVTTHVIDELNRESVAHRRRLRSLGLGARHEHRLAAAGILEEVAPGVLARTDGCRSWDVLVRAAVLATGGVASHGTAARLHGWPSFAAHPHVEVLCGSGRRPPAIDGVTIRFTRGPLPRHALRRGPIEVLDAGSTIALLAVAAPRCEVRRAIVDALRTGASAEELSDVISTWRCRGRPGPAVAAELLTEVVSEIRPRRGPASRRRPTRDRSLG